MDLEGWLKLAEHEALAKRLRAQALRMVHRARSPHIGSNLSIADILAVLYNGILQVDPKRPDWPERDRFILSKGHACAIVYAVLVEQGFFPKEWLETFCQDGGKLWGHICSQDTPGVEVSSGSLGHGLPIGCGIALAGKRNGQNYRVFVLLSDGECDEGANWEAALFAPQHHLDNLIAIVDYNKIQCFGRTKEVLDLEPFSEKWRTFGWAVCEIDGHNVDEIEAAMLKIPLEPEKPSCIIAHTIKGKGISFMENRLAWHYLPPNDDELRKALLELGVSD